MLAFAAAARLAVHRGDQKEVDRQLAQAMRARPTCTFAIPYLAVRVRLQLAKVYAAIADQATARHLLREIDDIVLHRPALEPSSTKSQQFRTILTQTRAGDWSRRDTAHARGASASPLPADPSHVPRDRAAAVRVPQHRQLRSRLDLSKTGRLLTQRRRAARDHGRPARRIVGGRSPTGLVFQGIVDVVPQRHRQTRRRRDHTGQPDDGNDPDQHIDDLRRGCTGAHRGIGLGSVGRHRATDRDQCGEADQCQRLRIELCAARRRSRASAKCSSLIASRRSTSV